MSSDHIVSVYRHILRSQVCPVAVRCYWVIAGVHYESAKHHMHCRWQGLPAHSCAGHGAAQYLASLPSCRDRNHWLICSITYVALATLWRAVGVFTQIYRLYLCSCRLPAPSYPAWNRNHVCGAGRNFQLDRLCAMSSFTMVSHAASVQHTCSDEKAAFIIKLSPHKSFHTLNIAVPRCLCLPEANNPRTKSD